MSQSDEQAQAQQSVAELARNNAGFVSLQQGAQSGLTESHMRRLVRVGDWLAVDRGIRRVRDADNGDPDKDRVRAALLLAGNGAVAAGYAAAALHGIVGSPAGAPLWIAVPRDRHPERRRGVRIIRTPVAGDDLVHVDSIPVTSVLRTLVDCARHGDQLPAVCLIESAARQGLVSLDAVRAAIGRIRGQRGSARAATALSRADLRSESPLETKARLLLLDAGLPYPEPQRHFSPTDKRRMDLAYVAPEGGPYAGLAIEIDGRGVHAKEAAFDADPRRQTALEEAGWLVRRFTDQHLSDIEYVVQTVTRALERVGLPTE